MLKLNTIFIEKKKYYLLPKKNAAGWAKASPIAGEKAKGELSRAARNRRPHCPQHCSTQGSGRHVREGTGRAAGIRVEILNGAEHGVTIPTMRTLTGSRRRWPRPA